nr:MAG TPA: hypothetical protein [Caudoviricetes sp.]
MGFSLKGRVCITMSSCFALALDTYRIQNDCEWRV